MRMRALCVLLLSLPASPAGAGGRAVSLASTDGTSLAANLALLAVVDLPVVRTLALLSPSLDYRGLGADAALLKRIGARPIWMAAGTTDPLSLRTLKELSAEASGPREQRIVEGPAHGTQLLAASSDISSALLDWLRRTLLS